MFFFHDANLVKLFSVLDLPKGLLSCGIAIHTNNFDHAAKSRQRDSNCSWARSNVEQPNSVKRTDEPRIELECLAVLRIFLPSLAFGMPFCKINHPVNI